MHKPDVKLSDREHQINLIKFFKLGFRLYDVDLFSFLQFTMSYLWDSID